MNETFWEYFYHQIKSSNYTVPLIVVAQLFAIFILLKNWRKELSYFLLFTYSFFGLFLFTGLYYSNYIYKTNVDRYTLTGEFYNIIFSVIELLTFSIILTKSIKSNRLIKINLIINAFFISISILILIFFFTIIDDNRIKRYLVDATTYFEITYIGILILIYFINLFKSSPSIKLTESPTFWLCAFSSLYAISLPISILLIEYYRYENRMIFITIMSLHYLSLSLVYFGISKAVLCKKPLTN